jgi:translin
MQKLEDIADRIRLDFDVRNSMRDQALRQARQLTRACSLAIRAVHRDDEEAMREQLAEGDRLAKTLTDELADHPDLFHTGYTQSALKEYAEAHITCALIQDKPLPVPEDLGLVYATYLNGLAEVVGELRRRILDILRHGYSEEAERLLSHMDEIYAIARSIIEKTRGDITFSLRGEHLEQAIQQLSGQLNDRQADSQEAEA